MKKKLAAIVTAIAVTVVSLAGCGNSTESSGSAPAAEAEKAEGETANSGNAEEAVRHKIGVILYGKDDSMGAADYAYLNYAAEALEVDIQWALNDYDAESQLASAENLVSAGCEGLLFLPINDNAVSLIGDYCQQNEIYFQMMNRDISDNTIKEATQANPYYVGTSFEANEAATNELTNFMAEEGRLKYGVGKVPPGSSLSVRNTAFEESVKAVNGTILADYTAPSDGSTQAYVTYIENFVNSYPEMDGLLLSSTTGGGGETIMNTLQSLVEPGAIKIVAFDTFEGMEEGFEDGWLTALAGGIAVQCVPDFIMLYNAVDKTPLAEGYTVLYQNFIFITNLEECSTFAQYIDNPEHMIYDAETIRSLAKRYNPDATLDDLVNLMESYSLGWVVDNAGQ